jgi:tetratricopeptide (TPR) repeat protein
MTNSLTDTLVGLGLVEARGESTETSVYVLHPGVAEAGRRNVDPEFAAVVDNEMRTFWWETLGPLLYEDVERTGLVIDSAQRGVPYLIRSQLWEEATAMLEQVVLRSPSPAVLDQTIPLLKKIVEASHDTPKCIETAGVLAVALTAAGQLDEAEKLQRQTIDRAVATENYRIAASTAGDLCFLLEQSGRLSEALKVAEQLPEYARLGNLGTWYELVNERMRLQILADINSSDENLIKQLADLYARMCFVPDEEAKAVEVRPYHEREMTLRLMGTIAVRLRNWEPALKLMSAVVQSKQARGASELDTARTLITCAECLIELKKYDEAKEILFYCKPVFEQAPALGELSALFATLGSLEQDLQHWPQANAHRENSLRYAYLVPTPQAISIAHFNLATTLNQIAPESPNAIAHRVAACVIDLQTNSGELESAVSELASDMKNFSTQAVFLPASFDELSERVEQTAGVRFRNLFAELPTRYSTGDEALAEALRLAQVRLKTQLLDNNEIIAPEATHSTIDEVS